MNELSLFAGAGGGVLGTRLLGWRSVGYIEWDKYCQQILAQRIKDGILDEAPIFGDIDDFIKSGAAKKYQGYVDVVTAGFPCQPFSVAGKKKGQDDERNKWPQTIQCIRDVRPRYALLENVPGLLSSGYFGEILTALAEAGFDARWCVLGADDVGAPHRRKRLWIKATSQDPERSGCLHGEHEEGRIQVREQRKSGSRGGERVSGNSSEVADSTSAGLQGHVEQSAQQTGAFARQGEAEDVADSKHDGLDEGPNPRRIKETSNIQQGEMGAETSNGEPERCSDVANSDEKRPQGVRPDDGQKRWEIEGGSPGLRDGAELGRKPDWWSTEPELGRVAHRVAHRVDRLKAIGNGQVPAVAAAAWTILSGGT